MVNKDSLHGLRAFLASREDSEHNQQLVRVVICLVTLVLFGMLMVGESFTPAAVLYLSVILLGILVSIGLFLHLLRQPKPSHGRRVVAISFDYAAIGAGMVGLEETFAFAYCYLLFVTVGYGIRYGHAYRITTVIVAMVTFMIVILSTDFWQQNLPLSFGLWVLLAAVPIYQVGLLYRTNVKNRKVSSASKAKSAFLAKLSHELRTPLSGIVLHSEMLASGRFSATDRADAARTIQVEAMLMLGIVQELLHVSEIEAGRVSVHKRSANVDDTIGQVIRLFKPIAAGKSVEIDPDVRLDTKHWVIDELHVRQVIVNVVSNAVKYTDYGKVMLAVRGNAAEQMLYFRVEDTGRGMDSYTLANLFKPFSDARVPVRRGDASGLGMHITKSLIDAMHGTIKVTSPRTEGGTLVEISIPAVPAADPLVTGATDQGERSFESLVDQHADLVGSKWIMIIDDVGSNLMIVNRLLQEGRHSTIPMQDAASALEAVREMSPDLILVDFHMPKMNAPEFIEAIRGLGGGAGRDIPVIVMTADVSAAVSEAALSAGATEVVHKPIQAADLFSAVERGLSFGARNPSLSLAAASQVRLDQVDDVLD